MQKCLLLNQIQIEWKKGGGNDEDLFSIKYSGVEIEGNVDLTLAKLADYIFDYWTNDWDMSSKWDRESVISMLSFDLLARYFDEGGSLLRTIERIKKLNLEWHESTDGKRVSIQKEKQSLTEPEQVEDLAIMIYDCCKSKWDEFLLEYNQDLLD